MIYPLTFCALGIRYTVGLKRSEEIRLNTFSRKVARGMTVQDAEDAMAPGSGKAFEAPIGLLSKLEDSLGQNKTMQEVKATLNVILADISSNAVEKIPCIEFLPQLDKDGQPELRGVAAPQPSKAPKKKVAKSATSKAPAKKGGPKTPKTASAATTITAKGGSSRVSQKGGIRKPKQEPSAKSKLKSELASAASAGPSTPKPTPSSTDNSANDTSSC